MVYEHELVQMEELNRLRTIIATAGIQRLRDQEARQRRAMERAGRERREEAHRERYGSSAAPSRRREEIEPYATHRGTHVRDRRDPNQAGTMEQEDEEDQEEEE